MGLSGGTQTLDAQPDPVAWGRVGAGGLRHQLGGAGSPRAPGTRSPGHLVVDALEVHQPRFPELELDPGQRVQPVQQGLG